MLLKSPLQVVLFAFFISTGFAQERRSLPVVLTVEANEARADAMVQFPLEQLQVGDRPVRLLETTGGVDLAVPVQVDRQQGKLCWIAAGVTAGGGQRTYRLEAGAAAKGDEVTVVDLERAIEARFAGKPLLRYNKAHVESPSGTNPNYGRSGHLHPVWTPSGAIVTDEFPPDHLHQSGIFLAFTKTKFEDRDVDFWNIAGGKGRVRFKELKEVASGPVFGHFRVVHEHVDLTAPDESGAKGTATAGGKPALIETWDVRISSAGWKAGQWLLDIASRVECAGASPLKLPEYHYGGMAIRAARSWTPQHVRFFTSERDERLKGNHTRPKWCDVSGLVDGQMAGTVLMTHPSNFRFPEPLRIHPTMPYMVYTPSFLGDWAIEPGQAYESRYRFVIHDGELTPEAADGLWQEYASPLVAKAH